MIRETVRREAEKAAQSYSQRYADDNEDRLRRLLLDKADQLAKDVRHQTNNTLRFVHDRARAQLEMATEQAVDGVLATVAGVVTDAVDRAVEQVAPRLVEVSVNAGGLTKVDGDTHRVLPDLLTILGAGCHAFLVGPAGTGKSTMAVQAAQALGLEFYALSVGPTTPTSKMFGYQDAGGSYHRTPLRDAYEHGGLMLLDELDNGHPGLLAELNQALSVDRCAFPDGMVPRHENFRLVATGNTYGLGADRQYVGRQALDAATLDRLVVLDVGVDEALETRMSLAQAPSAGDPTRQVLAEVRRLRRVAEEKKLPVIFSPRMSLHAARLLQAGADVEKVRRWCVIRGLSPAHREALGIYS